MKLIHHCLVLVSYTHTHNRMVGEQTWKHGCNHSSQSTPCRCEPGPNQCGSGWREGQWEAPLPDDNCTGTAAGTLLPPHVAATSGRLVNDNTHIRVLLVTWETHILKSHTPIHTLIHFPIISLLINTLTLPADCFCMVRACCAKLCGVVGFSEKGLSEGEIMSWFSLLRFFSFSSDRLDWLLADLVLVFRAGDLLFS